MITFEKLGISHPILKALESIGFEEPTPIQEKTIPLAMQEKDVIGQAQTGTGKTAAFGIPMIEKFSKAGRKIQGLVVTPTRELAIQVAEELNRLGRIKGIRALPIYGGQHMGRQMNALKDRPHIVVATPGRLLDHFRRRTIRPQTVEIVVLDEADEMLNMGFIEDIQEILSKIPETRQTLLFSATMPKGVRMIATNMMKNPEEIKILAKEMTVENIDQSFMEIPDHKKFDTLTNHLDIHAPDLAIVFSRTKKRVDELAEGLKIRGFKAEGIHGDLTQGKRMDVLNKFKRGQLEILVATDVAARGLDITGVTHVYNFDIPQDPESYVHRIGRTGRAGRAGEALSFVTPRELPHLQTIERMTKSKIKRITPPTNREAQLGQQQVAIRRLRQAIEKRDLSREQQIAKELLEEYDSVTVVAAAISLLTKKRSNQPFKLSAMQPLTVKTKNKQERSSRNRRRKPRSKRRYPRKKRDQ